MHENTPSTQPQHVSHAPQNPASPKETIPSDFELCAMLESISAIAYEEAVENPRRIFSDFPYFASKPRELLAQWHTKYQPSIRGNTASHNLMILWHFAFIIIHADLNALECAHGRDGTEAAQKNIPYARDFVQSTNGKRCVLHAMLIQRHFESLPAGVEPAFHVHLCLYYCGIIWASFIERNTEACSKPTMVLSAEDHASFLELQFPGIDNIGNYLGQVNGLQPRKLALGSLFRVISLLQRISSWRIAQNLASTLLALVDETPGLF